MTRLVTFLLLGMTAACLGVPSQRIDGLPSRPDSAADAREGNLLADVARDVIICGVMMAEEPPGENHFMTMGSGGDQGLRREVCWRVVDASSGRLVICAAYEIADAIELRVGYVDRILRFECFPDVMSARTRAEEWLKNVRGAGC